VVGNHLAIWVRLEDGWLADVGFGDGTLEPVALRPGSFSQAGSDFSQEALAGGWWRLHNHPDGAAPSFDFQLSPVERVLLERQCRFLQTSPASPFTRVAVVQRHVPEGLALLRGRPY
jgi:N-hydroxyarylamine O-acetyltransferase